jgi:hypothetical protein
MSRDELTVLTNDLYSCGKRHFKVIYPFYGETLFTLDTQGPALINIIDKERFDSSSRQLKPDGIDPKHMIQFQDLRDCLVSSNIIEYKNEREIIDWLRELKNQSKDLSVRSKPCLIAVDTNILYFCFISRHLSFQDADRHPFHSGFRYIVSDIVREEIDSGVEHKYTNDEIEAFKSTFKRRDLLNEFKNRCDLKARKAMLAFNECQFLRQELKAVGTSGKGSTNNEQNDREIARSYVRHARENNCDAFLLTADEKMVTHARTCDMATKQLLIQTEVPKQCSVNPWSVRNLIFDLAITMGAISIENNEAIILLGEWRGKTSKDYTDENLKVLVADHERYRRVKDELETCRKIRKLDERLDSLREARG